MHLPKYLLGKMALLWLIPIVLIASYFLFANLVIKVIAQKQLTELMRAEVNIDAVEHTLFPLNITIVGLQVTDIAKPTHNIVQLHKASADIKFTPLLSQKLIIHNLILEKMGIDKVRSFTGKVFTPVDPTESAFILPSIRDLPSVDEVLANSPLQTTKALIAANEVVKQYEQSIKKELALLPTKQTLKRFKTQVSALKDTDYKDPIKLLAAKKEFDRLKNVMRSEKQKMVEFTHLLKRAKEDTAQSLVALKQAPKNDFQLLKSLVAGDEAAITEITQSVFGIKADQYARLILGGIQLAKDSGNDTKSSVAVNDNTGIPNLWIKHAKIDVDWHGESLQGKLTNITGQHDVIDLPTEYSINMNAGRFWDTFDLSGNFKILQGKVTATQAWRLAGIKLENITLLPASTKNTLTAIIDKAILNSSGTFFIEDSALSGNSTISLQQLVMQARGENNVTKVVAEVLSQLSNINMQARFNGNLNKPSVKLSSDIDRQLFSALANNIANKDGKLAELQYKLNQQVATQLGKNGEYVNTVVDMLATAQSDEATLEALLQTKLNSLVDREKDKLLDKLKDKLMKKTTKQ